MNAMHDRSFFILELSLAVTGATHLPPTGTMYLLVQPGLGCSLSLTQENPVSS